MIDECKSIMLRPLVWGVSDCVVSAADVFQRRWGVDPIAEIRGRWRTRREAYRVLEDIGGWEEGFPFLFEAQGLVKKDIVGSIGLMLDPCPGLMIKAAPKLWCGKSMRGMVIRENVWGSWCLT